MESKFVYTCSKSIDNVIESRFTSLFLAARLAPSPWDDPASDSQESALYTNETRMRHIRDRAERCGNEKRRSEKTMTRIDSECSPAH